MIKFPFKSRGAAAEGVSRRNSVQEGAAAALLSAGLDRVLQRLNRPGKKPEGHPIRYAAVGFAFLLARPLGVIALLAAHGHAVYTAGKNRLGGAED